MLSGLGGQVDVHGLSPAARILEDAGREINTFDVIEKLVSGETASCQNSGRRSLWTTEARRKGRDRPAIAGPKGETSGSERVNGGRAFEAATPL